MHSRRKFLKFGLMGGAVIGIGGVGKLHALEGRVRLAGGGIDFSPVTRAKRSRVASACWQCVHRCNIDGFVENGRLMKIEGNIRSIRNRGKICAKGQAGINQVYDPDRVLHPMVRTGKRGEGKWKRLSWDAALDLVVNGGNIAGSKVKGIKTLRDEGHPEQFMFHYGRMKGSDSKIVKSNFLAAYGTGTIGNHTSICETAKWVAQELTWGKHYDANNAQNSNLILVFGCNPLEAHTSHIQIAERISEAREKGVKMYVFDVRLSNSAAKADKWYSVRPGTDLSILLALTQEVLANDWQDEQFIRNWSNVNVEELKTHYAQYTAEWAESVSGVPAEDIKRIAKEYAAAKPGTLITYRGSVAHYNGVDTERAAKTLDAILGYIDIKGGTCRGVGPSWKYPKPKNAPKAKKLKLAYGMKGDSLYPNHGISHRVLDVIADGKAGRPHVYMTYCYSPVYANGNCAANEKVLKDEKMIPFTIAVTPFYDEGAALADLILPDVTYLERLSFDDMVCYEQIPVHYIRQPMVKALGESRQFQDVCCDLAERMEINLGFKNTDEFLRMSCKKSHVPYEQIMDAGVWVAPGSKAKFLQHTKAIKPEALRSPDVLLDKETGVYWNWKKSKAHSKEEAVAKGYTNTKYAYKGYVGQTFPHGVFAGFKPDKINKDGKFNISSPFLEKKKWTALPAWSAAPEHLKMGRDDLILTSFKRMVQIHSRSANCKWLTELYHDNPAWIHPETAAKRGISDGDKIRVKSDISEIVTKARITEGVHPGVIAISHHCGHWQYGRYASGKKTPFGVEGKAGSERWWKSNGVHPNWIMPNAPDPVGGQIRMMDTVVKVTKV